MATRNGLNAHRAAQEKVKMVRGVLTALRNGKMLVRYAGNQGDRKEATWKQTLASRGCRDSNRNYERGKKLGKGSLDCRSSGTRLPDMCAGRQAIGNELICNYLRYIL